MQFTVPQEYLMFKTIAMTHGPSSWRCCFLREVGKQLKAGRRAPGGTLWGLWWRGVYFGAQTDLEKGLGRQQNAPWHYRTPCWEAEGDVPPVAILVTISIRWQSTRNIAAREVIKHGSYYVSLLKHRDGTGVIVSQ